MIHINIDSTQPPQEWLDKAARLTDEIRNAKDAETRREIINANRRLWADLKEWLKERSFGKCWYSEAKELCSFYDVDHFRPKLRALNLDESERSGYWWLAFDWRNYRLAGEICNRPNKDCQGILRGKADYFPLWETTHAATADSDLDDEIFYFLDPVDPDDPPLMTFDETGKPIPASGIGEWQRARVTTTVKFLHLDSPALTDERKALWMRCRRLIGQAQAIMAEAPSATRLERLRQTQLEMRELVSSKSELSATARACFLQSGYQWLQKIVVTSR